MAAARLQARLATALGAHPGDLRLAPRAPLQYQSNRLYDAWLDGRHLIVKEYLKPDEFDTAPRHEYEALRRLAPLDVAPQPLAYASDAGQGRPFVVYEYMAGAMWDRRRPSPTELAQLADLWLAVHSVTVPDMWLSRGSARSMAGVAREMQDTFLDYYAWAGEQHPPAIAAAAACLDLLAARRPLIEMLDAATAPLSFCRSDARFANVISRPNGRLGMVDWEDSGRRDPARELADLMTHSNQEDLLTPAGWEPFLQPYLAARQRNDPGLPRRHRAYMALFPLWWLAILIGEGLQRATNGTLRDWQPNGLAANRRLSRYLARAKAWPQLDFAEPRPAVPFFPDA